MRDLLELAVWEDYGLFCEVDIPPHAPERALTCGRASA